MVKGKVIQFRRGRHTIRKRHFLIEVEGVSNREDAGKFIGKGVEWKSPTGKIINQRIHVHNIDLPGGETIKTFQPHGLSRLIEQPI